MLGQKSWNPFKKEDPKQLVRTWQSTIRKEIRGIDRQILDMQREQRGAVKLIKDAAKRGDVTSAKIIAKEVVTIRRTVGKLAVNKATMISLSTQLSEQLAMASVAGTLSKSSEVMKLVNSLTKIPQMQATMREMSKEMYKAGVLEELVADTMDSAMDEEGLEEESAEAVDKDDLASRLAAMRS
ncbi:Vacuolar protein sorting-associated protein 24-like protein 1 [Auxenochlorella protothecoides]|uniref:Vacuolar protein sorting-associated protein 24-like protein 1 n=1 Tax=Auxenochlorella protothecoides TaxID=3075 RepID=A0A087SED1_AUXPR|nr:Vacuolar protein sorting-associated protein 24-like protein 1 [Auxenochlorella protothecoides]KFM24085.1 Vacuolar protein sorting-associated protein 24-like protein 1 [Auxenochlorella protothecoides]